MTNDVTPFGPGFVAATVAIPVVGRLPHHPPVDGHLLDLTTRLVDGALTAVGTIVLAGHGTDTFAAVLRSLACDADCTTVALDLEPVRLDRLGATVRLTPVTLDVTSTGDRADLLAHLVWALAYLLEDTHGRSSPDDLSTVLNRLLFGLGL